MISKKSPNTTQWIVAGSSFMEKCMRSTKINFFYSFSLVSYDVTNFLNEHPGGAKIVLKLGGMDATKQFENFHDVKEVLMK